MADDSRDLVQSTFEDNPPPKKKVARKKKTAAPKKTAAKKKATKAAKKSSPRRKIEVPENETLLPLSEELSDERTSPAPKKKSSAKAAKKTAKKAAKKAARKILAVPEEMKVQNEPANKTPETAEEQPASETKSAPTRRKPQGRVIDKSTGRIQKGETNQSEGKESKVETPRETFPVSGILDITSKGFGFLKEPGSDSEGENGKNDIFVPPDLIQKSALRNGQMLNGQAEKGRRGLQLSKVETVNGHSVEKAKSFPHFNELKAIFPDKRITLETTPDRFTTRVLDVLAPVGRGQRGLIVAPPRAGKTTLLLHIAEAVQTLHSKNLHLMVCLVDERPEEVTEFRRQLPEAEIYASSNDEPPRNHCRLAEFCIERAKRLVEAGEHVFLVMDSITRLARAYNNTMGGSKKGRGRGIQSGGIMAGALEQPRRLFAAARNTKEAGSLTILGTALVQTNSKADEAIFQEFKGTGNMELVLDRRIAEHFVYPAVDLFKSGTRREELLLPEHTLQKINLIRRGLAGHRPTEAMERLLFFLKRFPNNAQMLLEIKG